MRQSWATQGMHLSSAGISHIVKPLPLVALGFANIPALLRGTDPIIPLKWGMAQNPSGAGSPG